MADSELKVYAIFAICVSIGLLFIFSFCCLSLVVRPSSQNIKPDDSNLKASIPDNSKPDDSDPNNS